MSFLALIRSDVAAKARWVYGDASRRSLLKALCTDGTGAMILYRLMQAAQRRRLAPLAMLFNKANALVNRCIIGRGAQFGPEFVLVHCLGVVINSAVVGGRHVVLEHQVTLGAEKNEHPVLGDDVFIGAGAKVVGGVKIGSRVKIGANAVVVTDLPDDCTAVGIPARILERRGREEAHETQEGEGGGCHGPGGGISTV
jgi:serine O-acetyltransferase